MFSLVVVALLVAPCLSIENCPSPSSQTDCLCIERQVPLVGSQQNQLSEVCVRTASATQVTYFITFTQPLSYWTGGGNTGNACLLFDGSDGDLFVDQAVCVTLIPGATPTATATQWSCANKKLGSCSAKAEVVTPFSPTCTVSSTTATSQDPGAHTLVTCTFGKLDAALLPRNLCSQSSASPTSSTFMCLLAGCTTDADCSYMSDTDCNLGKCQSSVCTTVKAPIGTSCNDGDACTVNDKCTTVGGTTTCGGTPIVCNDNVACTVDTCSSSGCVFTKVDTNCDDNVACTENKCTSTGCSFPENAALCQYGCDCTGSPKQQCSCLSRQCAPSSADRFADGCVYEAFGQTLDKAVATLPLSTACAKRLDRF